MFSCQGRDQGRATTGGADDTIGWGSRPTGRAEPRRMAAKGATSRRIIVMQETTNTRFLDVVRGTPLEACFDFWRGRPRVDGVPLKAAIDPIDMPRRILPNLFLYRQEADGRFRCRLAGTEICRVFGHNPTGLYLDNLVVPSAVTNRQHLFTRVVERRLPVVYGGLLVHSEDSLVRFLRLLLPVAAAAERADHVFGMVIFFEQEAFHRRRARPHDGLPDLEAWAAAEDLDIGRAGGSC
jgi:hypothetical protein